MSKSILISVAHSAKSRGAVDQGGTIDEYLVSQRASEACWRSLAGEYSVELFDVGAKTKQEYDDLKVERVNTCRPSLAIEIHCNADGTGKAKYSECIYASDKSTEARAAAACIARSLGDGFSAKHWPSHGARADDRGLFFLQRTIVPAVIVEGLFISNIEQANWLMKPNGSDPTEPTGMGRYGTLVAEGLKAWLRGGGI